MDMEQRMANAESQTELVILSREELQHVETEQGKALEIAQSLVVESEASETMAWNIINRLGDLKKRIEADFADSKSLAHKTWKAICTQEKGHLDKLQAIDAVVRPKLGAWEAEKRRRQAAAEKEAREERERLEAEARRLAEEERLKVAEDFEAMGGDAETVDQILDLPVEVAPVIHAFDTARPAPKVSGAGAMVEVWKAEIVDEALVPREYLMVDTVKLNKVVAAMKGSAKIPGVRVFSEYQARRAGRAG